jgi:hypothetical protein
MRTSFHLFFVLIAALAWTLGGCDNNGSIVFGDDDDDATGDDDTGDDDTGDDDTGDDDTGGDCAEAAVEFDFEDGDGGFNHQSTTGGFADPWELGTPADADCASGDSCWATRLEGDYGDCEAGELVSPVFDLSACDDGEATVQLIFMHLFRFEEGQQANYDGGAVQLSADGGDSWVDVDPDPPYTGFIDGNYSECPDDAEIAGHQGWSSEIPANNWTKVSVDVGAAYFTDGFRVRFLFGSDRGVTEEGWYVDDVSLFVE